MKIFDQTLSKLETSLDLRLERHNLLASNVANANTPGYTPRDLDFNQAMAKAEGALATAPDQSAAFAEGGAGTFGSRAPSSGGASGADPAGGTAAQVRPAGFDGNRVDADQAMVALAENAVQYGASAQAVNKKLAILLYTASDGNG